jgi:hypothetical protein
MVCPVSWNCLHKPCKDLAHNGSYLFNSNLLEIKLTLALSDIADPVIFAKKGLATFCCPSYPNGG